jgi:hypothetical protein
LKGHQVDGIPGYRVITGLRFRVKGLGFRFQVLGFEVQGLGLRV